MADLTVSSDVDSMLASADDAAIRAAIGGVALIQGFTELPFAPGAWKPDDSTPPQAVSVVYSGNEVDAFSFDAAGGEFLWAQIRLPLDYLDASVFRWGVDWDAVATASGTAQFALSGRAFGNDDPLNGALGTARTIIDTLLAVGDRHFAPNDATGVTLANSPIAGDFAIFRFEVTSVGTIAVDVLAEHISIQYQQKTTQPVAFA